MDLQIKEALFISQEIAMLTSTIATLKITMLSLMVVPYMEQALVTCMSVDHLQSFRITGHMKVEMTFMSRTLILL